MEGERACMADAQREKPEAIWKCKVIQMLQEDSGRSEMAKAIKRRERGIPLEQNARLFSNLCHVTNDVFLKCLC